MVGHRMINSTVVEFHFDSLAAMMNQTLKIYPYDSLHPNHPSQFRHTTLDEPINLLVPSISIDIEMFITNHLMVFVSIWIPNIRYGDCSMIHSIAQTQ
jgi:hypothetical protein